VAFLFLKKRQNIITLLLALCAVVLYLPTLGADFVWDSRAQVLIDTFIHQPRHLLDVLSLRVLSLDVLDNNRPTNLLALMLDSMLWGKRPVGYHLSNIVLHGVSVALLFRFVLRVLRESNVAEKTATLCAATGAGIFAIHPINCEAVAEPSYREDLLVAFFILAGLNLATHFTPRATWKLGLFGFGCILCFLLAVGAKESGIAGPFALIAYWLLWRRREPKSGWLILVAVTTLVVTGFLVARFALEPPQSAIFTKKPTYIGGSLTDALFIQQRIWAFYFRQIIFPQDLCADYGPYSVRNFDPGISVAVVALVLCAQIICSLTHRVFALGAVIFWTALLPVSNFVPIYRAMADRFLYLPIAGAALMLTDLLRHWRFEKKPVRVAAMLLGSAVVLACVTFQREKIWHDELALWRDTAQKNPFSVTAADNLGWALYDAERPTEAIEPFRRAIQISEGKHASAFGGLALAFEATGHPNDADAAWQKAVALDSLYADPPKLVTALVLTETQAQRLGVIAQRNR
jgi:protein O-mannosyl-transferase